MSHTGPTGPPPSTRRKNTSRACGNCKQRKSKCDGEQPCARCMSSEIVCEYAAQDRRAYRRSRGKSAQERLQGMNSARQPPGLPVSTDRGSFPPFSSHSPSGNTSPPPPAEREGGSTNNTLQESEKTDEDLGDISTHAFLKRISGHLSLMGKALPRNITREREDVDDLSDNSMLILPDRSSAIEYMDCFFDHLNATYRYLPRTKMRLTLDQLYQSDSDLLRDDASLALLLSIMGSGCIWLASWKSLDLKKSKSKANNLLRAAEERLHKISRIFPPSLTTLQAHFAYCQALISSHKYNSAWIMLGKTIRLAQIVGLGKTSAVRTTPLEEFQRRGLFWSMFMMDRYLSIILGRPFGIQANDISVKLPQEPEESLVTELGSEEGKLVPGTVAHIQLLKITSRVMLRLYGVEPLSSSEKEQIVSQIEAELVDWANQVPSFFHPEQGSSSENSHFYNIPWLFKRQQRTIRSAYYFTNMLLYRSFLLQDFMGRVSSNPTSSPPSELGQKCRNTAISMAEFATELAADETYNAVFWGTSHFIFCSIAILVVSLLIYDNCPQLENVIESGMKAHMKLSISSNTHRQRLLEESRSMAKSVANESPSLPNTTNNEDRGADNLEDLFQGFQTNQSSLGAPDLGEQNFPDRMPLPEFQGQIDPSGMEIFSPFSNGAALYNMDMNDIYGLGSGLDMIMDIGFGNEGFRNQ